MATNIVIPDFDFSGFYYAELLEALRQYRRRNVPELTDESEFEPFTQLERMMALVGHLNNTLLDLVANENTLPTAKLPEVVRNMLRLIDYEMRSATPAQVDIVYELTKVFTAQFEIIAENSQAATKKTASSVAIYFEALEALIIDRTDQFGYVFADESGVFTDYTAKANSPTTPADDFTPWVTAAVKDAIYWGHKQIMWDTLSVLLTTPGANIAGVFEFYDGKWVDDAPSTVTDIGGGQLQFDLTSILGNTNRQGTVVRVQLNETTAYEQVESTWTGTKNIATTGLLGQTSPSTDATKYAVGSDWKILADVSDEPNNFTANGKVEYPLPQTVTDDWQKTTVFSAEAYWIRYRITSVSTPSSPVFQRCRLDEGKQYVLRSTTQGQSRTEILGSSTGLANQQFQTSKEYFIANSQVITVDTQQWTEVRNFLNSQPADRHYTVELGENDVGLIKFGDGTNGRIPPLGVGNIEISYRHNAKDDGNVGANTVTVDKTGLTFINKHWNPRQATGWAEAQSASTAGLELAKMEGPASLRTKDVALGPNDVEDLTIAFVDEDGAAPFSRATTFEESYGPKTIECVVVANGGGLASAVQLAALETYFNGDKFANPPVKKHIVANQEVTAVNYTQKPINVTATVYGNVTQQQIINRLLQVIRPEALKEDGVSWEWEFGAEVPDSRINHEIFETDESIVKVVLTEPSAPVPLLARELPVAGTINITVIIP